MHIILPTCISCAHLKYATLSWSFFKFDTVDSLLAPSRSFQIVSVNENLFASGPVIYFLIALSETILAKFIPDMWLRRGVGEAQQAAMLVSRST